MTMSQALLPEFDNEMKFTRKALERVPDDKFDWKPHAKSMSLGRLAGHLAELVGFATAIIGTDGVNFDKGEYKPLVAKNRAEVLEAFDKNVAATHEAIAGATDDHLRQPWHLIYQEKKLFEAPRAAALRSMAINHIIHHRGQLTVYLRLNDVAVPSIYGPSADEM
ncbi:MAG TPA: DinB family protein [Bryobacteraceae bacterium]|nr:DinB family protein [Bryobacteraceae bacterium]